MRSVSPHRDPDRTAEARVRDAAIELFGEQGTRGMTIRAVAERAGVSPALVLHHYGSKDGLRAACDQHVLTALWQGQESRLTGGGVFPLSQQVTDRPELATHHAYLARLLAEGGEPAQSLFDRLCEDTLEYLAMGERVGTIRPTSDPEARAAAQATIGLGFLVLGPLLARRLGGAGILDPAVVERYGSSVYELYLDGLVTGPLADQLRAGLPDPRPTRDDADAMRRTETEETP